LAAQAFCQIFLLARLAAVRAALAAIINIRLQSRG
jgi:hypothetical protein